MQKTGIAFNRSLKIEKKYASGEYMSGYPKIYNLCDAFDDYNPITPDELKELSVKDYDKRAKDFERYVSEQENVENLNLSNQALNYDPESCVIGDDFAVSISVIIDTNGVLTDAVNAYFAIYDKQFDAPQTTAKCNRIICTTNDKSGDFAFAGWADSNDPNTIISADKQYEFMIEKDTALIAKWTRENAVRLVLTATKNIDSVSGDGNYALGALVSAQANLKAGATFAGWYKNGNLVSVSQKYTFNIIEYTELEARASMESDEYQLSVNKNTAILNGQGYRQSGRSGAPIILVTSSKNGEPVPFVVTVDSEWITVDKSENSFIIYAGANNTTTARNGTITVTQPESGKQVYVNVQQQVIADDTQYEWVINDLALLDEIEKAKNETVENSVIKNNVWTFNSFKDWSPSDPYLLTPSDPCTYDDFMTNRKLFNNTYTVTLVFQGLYLSTKTKTVTANIWFEPKIKS
jgi:hypothetical protein